MGKILDEFIHIAAQEGALAASDTGDAASEQVAGIQRHQVLVLLLVVGHGRYNAYPQAQPHIGLDDVGIGGGKHHPGLQALLHECFIQLGPQYDLVEEDGFPEDFVSLSRSLF